MNIMFLLDSAISEYLRCVVEGCGWSFLLLCSASNECELSCNQTGFETEHWILFLIVCNVCTGLFVFLVSQSCCSVLYYAVLQCTVLYYTVLYYTSLCCTSILLHYCTILYTYTYVYRIVGNFRGVLIFVIFVTIPRVTKFSTHEIFHPRIFSRLLRIGLRESRNLKPRKLILKTRDSFSRKFAPPKITRYTVSFCVYKGVSTCGSWMIKGHNMLWGSEELL